MLSEWWALTLIIWRWVIISAVTVAGCSSLCMRSVLALTISPFLYAPVLLDIVPDVKIMSFILTAIRRNRTHLFFTVLLSVVFMYLVAVFVYLIVPDQYNLGGHSDCHDIVRCFKLHLDYGLFNSPDWIGELKPATAIYIGLILCMSYHLTLRLP